MRAHPVPGGALGPLDALPEVRVVERRVGERFSMLLLRKGDQLRAHVNLCPHQYLPLTHRTPNTLSADGQRLRCSNRFAEFGVEDGLPSGRGLDDSQSLRFSASG